jgi:hypothetical protein
MNLLHARAQRRLPNIFHGCHGLSFLLALASQSIPL